MTKKELAVATAKKLGLNQSESKELMDATFNVLTGYLSIEKSVTIPHFGSFSVHKRRGHRFFNIMRSAVMMSPHKHAISFHPSKEYKESMQQEVQS